tara:strand:+ start:923 stop:1636 length:714 start_codon:yes stop_codon:yes gene_type:complete
MSNYLFDVDGTLTPHRQEMTEEFKSLFIRCLSRDQKKGHKIFLVTGSNKEKTIEQVGKQIWLAVDGCYQNSGNQLYRHGKLIKQSSWTPSGGVLSSIRNHINNSVWNGTAGSNIEDRIGTLNFCTIGRDCTQEQRDYYYEWDQQWREREHIVTELSKQYPEVEFVTGGQISIDVYPKGKDKSQVLNDMEGEVFFVGDNCGEGGNDHSIHSKLDIFHSFWVKDYRETMTMLENSYEQA